MTLGRTFDDKDVNILSKLQQFFSGWRFPVVLVTTVFSMIVLMAVTLIIPDSAGAAGEFAEAFKTWCFGYDPATGTLEWAYVWMFLVQPFLLIGLVLLVWNQPIREVLKVDRNAVIPYIGAALLFVSGLGATVVVLNDATARPTDERAFPAERIRTTHQPAPFSLTNQDGDPVELEALRGKVVLVTAVYARCGFTCPMILGQARRAVAALSPEDQESLHVVGISLDPEHDVPDVLRRMAIGQGVSAPLFNLVTGEPGYVGSLLDRYGFERKRDEETGVIDHTNLFVLIDRNGRVAYRFSLGDQQERWLTEALQLLVREEV